MNSIDKYDEKRKEIDYYKSLVMIASKSGTTQMAPETLLNIMLTAKDLGISPLKAINGGFYVVNGKISMSTALMADRIRKEGHSIRIPEWTNKKCAIIGIRKDNGDSVKFEFTMEDATAAGLTNSPTWKKFPKQMLYNRAMSTLARTLFPDVVGNAYSEDEKYDIMNIPAEKRPDEDPDMVSVSANHSTQQSSTDISPVVLIGTPLETLREHLAVDGIDTEQLEPYLKMQGDKKGWDLTTTTDYALMPAALPRFKQSYIKHLASIQPVEVEAAAV